MSYVELGILFLRLANGLLAYANNRAQFSAGQDAEIAKASMAVLAQTALGKRITEQLDAMPAGERDDLDDALGRAGGQG